MLRTLMLLLLLLLRRVHHCAIQCAGKVAGKGTLAAPAWKLCDASLNTAQWYSRIR